MLYCCSINNKSINFTNSLPDRPVIVIYPYIRLKLYKDIAAVIREKTTTYLSMLHTQETDIARYCGGVAGGTSVWRWRWRMETLALH